MKLTVIGNICNEINHNGYSIAIQLKYGFAPINCIYRFTIMSQLLNPTFVGGVRRSLTQVLTRVICGRHAEK